MTVYYGGGGYGTEPYDISGEITPSGSASRQLNYGSVFAGSIAPSGSLDLQYITSSQSVSGSLASSGAVSLFLNKQISRELIPHTNDSSAWALGDEFPSNINNEDESVAYTHIDGLQKFTYYSLDGGSIPLAGDLVTNHIQKQSVSGALTPAATLGTTQFFMYSQSVSGSITPSGDSNSVIADPNDLNSLVIANAQNVIPKVKAYWSTGKFVSNLRGFSSSDIYQDKTLSMNPIVNWRFDEYSSPGQTIALDSGENDYDGFYSGTIYGVAGALRGPNEGSYGIQLIGNGFVYANSNADFNQTDNFQIELWIKIPSIPAYEMFICSKGNGSSNINKQYAISIGTDKKINAYAYAGSNEYKVDGITPLNTGQWYHIILSVKNNNLRLFLNGEEDGTYATISGNINTTTGPLVIGRSSESANYFIGSIDEFAMYSSADLTGGGSAYARYRSGINTGEYIVSNRFYPEQIMNGHSRVSYVWGVTDTKNSRGNIITANGEVYTMEDEDTYRYEHGWWSRSISDNDGKMVFVETVLCEFDAHTTTEIEVFTSEFFAGAKEIDIYYKDSSDIWTLLNDGVVIDNNDYNVLLQLIGVTEVNGIRVDVKSIWAAQDVARIEEVDPLYAVDISDDIVSFNLDQNREDFDSNIPIGSAASNSLTLTLDNTDLAYSVYNSGGPYYEYLLPDVRFEVELGWFGTQYNYEPLGTFWADEWQESSDGMTVDVRCRDYSKFLQETTNTGNVWFDISGGEAIANLLKESNYPLYDIDFDLNYSDACIRSGAAGAWMMHESGQNKYILHWPADQSGGAAYAEGVVDNGPNGDFTLMFWVRCPTPTTPSAPGIIDFSKWAMPGAATDRVFVWNPHSMIVSIGANDYNTNIRLTDYEWHHIAISWDQSTGAINVYDNGVLKSSGTTATGNALTGKHRLYLGGPGLYGTKFYGDMGQIALVGRTMTQQEISDMAFRNILACEKDVRIHYSLEEGFLFNTLFPLENQKIYSTVSSKDSLKPIKVEFRDETFLTASNAAATVDGTYYGSVILGEDNSPFAFEPYTKTPFFYGERPSALFFDKNGSNGVSTPATATTTITGDIDIFIRFSLNYMSGNQFFVGQHPGSNDRNFSVGIDSSGKFKYTYSTNGATDTTILSAQTLAEYNIKTYDKVWLRISHDVNDTMGGNKVTFSLSKDNTNEVSEIPAWLPVTTVTNAGTVVRHSSTTNITVGMDSSGGNKMFGKIYSLKITNGIDSSDVRMEFNPENFTSKNMTVFYGDIGNAWTVNDAILYTDNNSFMYIAPNQTHDVLNDSFSVSIWAYFQDQLGDFPLFANESFSSSSFSNEVSGGNPFANPTQGSIEVGVTSLGQVYVNSGLQENATSRPTLQANQWHFISVVFDKSTNDLYIYIDGKQRGKSYFSAGFSGNNLPWFVGTDARGGYLGSGGYLGGFVIHDYALSESQVLDLYRAGGSLVTSNFDLLWAEEGETLWDVMLQVATADLGTFYFNKENKFIYKNALNNYSAAFKEFTEPQWYFDDDIDVISGSQSISLQANKIIVRLSNIGVDLNKKEVIWQAPDNTIIVGGTLSTDLSISFTEYLSYDTKTLIENGVHVKTPDFLPSGFVKIDSEIIGYERKDERKLYGLTRGAFNTEPAQHSAASRLREVRVFNIEYQSKPSAVLENPFITAELFDGTVDIDVWRPDVYGAKLVISRNENGDAFLVQKLQNTDPLNNINNYISVVGTPLVTSSSNESIEYESAEYSQNIRRFGIKQVEFTNRFINSSYRAKKYAEYFLQHFLNPVPIIEVAIMGNPMIELGERVRVVTFDRMGMSQQDFWIEKISINYSGGIDQTLTLRKVS